MSSSSDNHNHIRGHNSHCAGDKTDPSHRKMSRLRSRSPSSECLSRCCSRSSSRSSSSSSASSHSCSCSSCCSSGSSASSQSSSSGSESSSSSDSESGHVEEKVTSIGSSTKVTQIGSSAKVTQIGSSAKVTQIGSSAIRDKSAKYVLSTTREPLKLTISKSSLGPTQHRSKTESHSLSSSIAKSPSRNRLGSNQSQCDQCSFNVSDRERNNDIMYERNNDSMYERNNDSMYERNNVNMCDRNNHSIDLKSDENSGNSKRIMSSAEERQKLRSFRINHVRNRSSNTQPLPSDQVPKPDLASAPSRVIRGQSIQCTTTKSHEIPSHEIPIVNNVPTVPVVNNLSTVPIVNNVSTVPIVNKVSTVPKAGNSQVENVVPRHAVNEINSPVTKSFTSSSTPVICTQIMSMPSAELVSPIYSNSVQTSLKPNSKSNINSNSNSKSNSNLIHSKESSSNPVSTATASTMSPFVSDVKSIGRNVERKPPPLKSLKLMNRSNKSSSQSEDGKGVGTSEDGKGVGTSQDGKSLGTSGDGKSLGTVDGEKRKLVVDESKLIGYRDLVNIPHNTHILQGTETQSSTGPVAKNEPLHAPVLQLTKREEAELSHTKPSSSHTKPSSTHTKPSSTHTKPSSTSGTKKKTLITKAARKCMSFSESSNSPEEQSESSPKVPSTKVPNTKVPNTKVPSPKVLSPKPIETERKNQLTCQSVEFHRDELRKQHLFLSSSNPDLFSPPIKRRDLNSPSHSVASSRQSVVSPSLRQEWTKEDRSKCSEKMSRIKTRYCEVESQSKKKTRVPTKAAVKCMFADPREKGKGSIIRKPVGPAELSHLVHTLDELRIDDARYSRRIMRQSNNCFSGNKASPKLHSPISSIFSEPKNTTPNPVKKFSAPSPSASLLSPSLRNDVLQQNFYSNQLLYQLNLYNEFLAGQLSTTPSPHIHPPPQLLMPPLLASQLIWPKILSHLQSVAPVPIPGGHNLNFDSPRSYQSASPAGPKIKSSPLIPTATTSSSSRKEKKSKHKNHGDIKSRSCSREEVKSKKKKSKKKETVLGVNPNSLVSMDLHRGEVSNKQTKRKSSISPSSDCATEGIEGVKSSSRKSGKRNVAMNPRNEEGTFHSGNDPSNHHLLLQEEVKKEKRKEKRKGSRSRKGAGESRSEREEGGEKKKRKEEREGRERGKGREMKGDEQSEPFPSSLANKETTRFGCQQRLPFQDNIPCSDSPLVNTEHDLSDPRSEEILDQPATCVISKPTVSTVDRIIEECSRLPLERLEEESSGIDI